jgi:hypothetical protein
MRRSLANTPDTPVIDDAALQQGIAKATAIFQFQAPRATTDLKQFARKLEADRELLRSTWSVPTGEACLTVAALRQLVLPVGILATKTSLMGHQLAESGVRQLVAEQYRRVASDLNRDAFEGQFGIGGLVATLSRQTSSTTEMCLSAVELRKRILFVLGRIQIAMSTYVELEDMRPWFARNAIADAVMDTLLAVGGFAVAVATAAGNVVQTTADLIDTSAKVMDFLLKASLVGAGIWVYFNYIKEPRDHGHR